MHEPFIQHHRPLTYIIYDNCILPRFRYHNESSMDWLDSAPHTLLTDSHWLHRPLTLSAYRPPANDIASSVAVRPTVRPPPHLWNWNITRAPLNDAAAR